MRGLNKLIIQLLIFVIICNETHLSFTLTHDNEEGEPFNIGQQLITHKDARLVQNQLYYFQYDQGSITVDRLRFAYGFSDEFGIQATVPYYFQNNSELKTHGFGDMRLVAQWNPFRTKEHLGTLRFGIEFPAKFIGEIPEAGAGVWSYVFEAGTFHSSYNWYFEFFVLGFKRTKKNHYLPGDSVRFSTNTGPKIHFNHKKSKLFMLAQLRGIYEAVDTQFGKTVPNTGKFVALLGPLFSYRHKRIIIEGSPEFVITQRYHGIQNPLQWVGTLTLQISF